MLTIVLQVLGAFVFLTGTFIIGRQLKGSPDRNVAERTSRFGHLLIYSCLVFPGTIGIFYPGLTNFDSILGIRSLPVRRIAFSAGALALLTGLYLLYFANRGLKYRGMGASAFKLTKKLVVGGLHREIRNPMSLGYYLTCVGIAVAAGSTYLTLGSLFVIVPSHIFYLKYFEELELEIRFGQSYRDYKRNVPFMIPRFFHRDE